MAQERVPRVPQACSAVPRSRRRELDAVGAVVTDLRFNAGEVLIRQGDSAHEMFIVTAGDARGHPRWPSHRRHRPGRVRRRDGGAGAHTAQLDRHRQDRRRGAAHRRPLDADAVRRRPGDRREDAAGRRRPGGRRTATTTPTDQRRPRPGYRRRLEPDGASRRPSAWRAKRPASRPCTGSSSAHGQPPNWVRW